MKQNEISEINNIPKQYRPMGAWNYFFYQILFAIPLVGIICLIVFSLDSSNIVRRGFARSYFCGLILLIILIVIMVVLGVGTSLLARLQGILDRIPSLR